MTTSTVSNPAVAITVELETALNVAIAEFGGNCSIALQSIGYGECFTVAVSYDGINLHQAHTWLQVACKMIAHNTTQQYFADVEVIESMVDHTPQTLTAKLIY